MNVIRKADLASLAAYGWRQNGPVSPATHLAHDFYEVDYLPENDRVHCTISPQVRREILKNCEC